MLQCEENVHTGAQENERILTLLKQGGHMMLDTQVVYTTRSAS